MESDTWDRDALAESHVPHPGSIVIVEGVHSMLPELTGSNDYTVWVDAPSDIRPARGLARDGRKARDR